MCNEYPGPRCSNHGFSWLKSAEQEFYKVRDTDPNSLAFQIAEQNLLQAQYDYNCTPDGIEAAKRLAKVNPEDSKAQKQVETFQRQRSQQIEALAEQKNGRANKIAQITTAAQNFYDLEEMSSLVSAIRKNSERVGMAQELDDVKAEDAQAEYLANLNRIEQNINDNGNMSIDLQKTLTELRAMDAPTSAITLKTYSDILKALPRSQAALKNELNTISTIQNVPVPVARAYYDAYREQYKNTYAGLLKKTERPDPPKEWVSGDYHKAGFQNEPVSAFAPSDEASMYALYRLRVDEKAIPDYLKTSKVFAAVNLSENPDNITENPKTSMVFYTAKGKKLGQYEMQAGRSLRTHLPEIANQLQGKTIITQNSHQESAWIKEALPTYGLKNVPVMTISELSSKHLNLPSNNLKSICEKTGVEYRNDGIESETETTMKAFLSVRKKVQSQWLTKPARKNAEPLQDVPLSSRW